MVILCPLHIREAHFQGKAHMYFRGPREWNELAVNIKNFLIISFIRNNFKNTLYNLKYILNIIKLL